MKTQEKKILLVEDEPSVRNGLNEWLTEDGYSIDSVETGEQALERIQKEPYGVIILDLKLPDIDGLQLFEIAKKLRPEIKGVVITAFPSKETYEKGGNLGILNYLPKPFKVDALKEVLNAALGETEGKKIEKKNKLAEIGALSYRVCDLNYECGICPLTQEIEDKFGTFILIENKEVEKLKQQSGVRKFCRFGSIYVVPGVNPFLD